MRVVLVGAGSVGTAVAYLLAQKGHEVVGVSSRTRESAERAAERLNTSATGPSDIPEAELVLIGASDSGIAQVVESLAPQVMQGAFVCHFAGSLGIAALARVIDRDAYGCAIHPVQACPNVDAAIARLPGSAWGVTCSHPEASDAMTSLIRSDLRGFPVEVPDDVRPLWHAAAVMTSNGVAALLAMAETLLVSIGVDEPEKVLGPLASGTVMNAIEGGGGGETLTGPVVRGEVETIKRHMEHLAAHNDDRRKDYKMVLSLIFIAAVRAGRIDRTSQDLVNAILAKPS